MDKSEKKILMISAAVLMTFIFSILYARGKYNDLPECVPYDKAYLEPKVTQVDDKLYQVFAVAQMWQFQPEEVYIPLGSEVDFFLTSKDVVHGFNIADKNVNLTATYGNINKTTVKFDKPGIYYITCHEYCGVGHQAMRGRIIVNDPTYK